MGPVVRRGNWSTVISSPDGLSYKKSNPDTFVAGLCQHFDAHGVGPRVTSPDADPVIVMETLRPLDATEDPGRLAKDLVALLARVHGAGVLHFDLKVDNVMRAADGTLRLIDFDKVGCANLATSSIRFDELEDVRCDDVATYVSTGLVIFCCRQILDRRSGVTDVPPLAPHVLPDLSQVDWLMFDNEDSDILQNYVDDIAGHVQGFEADDEEPPYSELFRRLLMEET